jgi:hydrogenase maturation protease
MSYWEELERPGPDAVVVDGVELRRRSRVRLRPRAGGDVLDLALAGRTALVEAIETDMEGNVALAVTVDGGGSRKLFFAPSEVEPLAGEAPEVAARRILVAGIGNVFLGDDGFGVALAGRLARMELGAGVRVIDFGIRGMDLAYALLEGYEAAVLLDATPRGAPPGTLYVIEPELDDGEVGLDTHGMDPVKVLATARGLADGPLPRVLVVGCEPQTRMTGDEDEIVAALSEPVRAALDEGCRLVVSVLDELKEER